MNPGLQHKILQTTSRIAAVTVRIMGRDSYLFHAVLLQRKKGLLEIVDRKRNLTSVDALYDFIPKTYPVVASIEGWGVLIKPAQFDEKGQAVGSVIPDNDDFILFTHVDDSKGFVAIIRKDLFIAVEDLFKDTKYDFLGLNIGLFNLNNLIPTLNIEGECIVGGYKVIIEEDTIKEIKTNNSEEEDNFKIGDDLIASCYLSGFALGANMLCGGWEIGEINQDLIIDYTYKKLSVLSGWAILGMVFIGLLINYLLFDSYSKEYTVVSGQYQLHENVLKQLSESEEQLKMNRELISKGGLSGQSTLAWYADRLVSLMPSKIVLTKIALLPLDRKIQKRGEVSFQSNTIVIEGETSETLLVHRWIEKIKEEHWITHVELGSYNQERDHKKAVFSIKINFQ